MKLMLKVSAPRWILALGLAGLGVLFIPADRGTRSQDWNFSLSTSRVYQIQEVAGVPSAAPTATTNPLFPAALPDPSDAESNPADSDNSPFVEFLKWAEEYTSASDANKATILTRGLPLAAARRVALRALIENDPEAALAAAVPARIRQAMPAAIATHLENRIDGTGDLDVIGVAPGVQGPDGPGVIRFATLHQQQWRAYVFGRRAFEPARSRLPIHGIAIDNVIAVDQWPGRILEPEEAADARARLTAEPVCEISQEPTAATGEETALAVGEEIEFFCGPAHALRTLHESAGPEASIPPGLGKRHAAEATAASGESGISVPSFGATGNPLWTTGGKRLAFVRLSFNNVDKTGLTVAQCTEVITRMNDQLSRWSYGKYSLRPVGAGSIVTPIRNISASAFEFDTDDIGRLWFDTAIWLMQTQGNPSYDLLVVAAGDVAILKPNGGGAVTWGGLGRIGKGASFLRVGGENADQRIARNAAVGLHEIGHNLGLFHASSRFTTPQTIVPGYAQTSLEYGDRFDIMGSGPESGDYNVRFKQWLRWLSASEVPSAVSNGRYAIRPHDLGENFGIRGLKVPFGSQGLFGDSLYVEYRASTPDNPLLHHGVSIRLGQHGAPKTHLLDATPETPNHVPDNDYLGTLDSPLLPGRTYSHTLNGRTVHLTNVETRPGAAAWIQVAQGTPSGNRAPTGTITSQSNTLELSQTVYLTADATDPDGDPLAYHWIIPRGSLSESAGPHPNERTIPFVFRALGNRNITCIVSDMHGGTRTLTRTFTVTTNQAPVISTIPNQTTTEDTALTTPTFTVSDATTPAASITVTATSGNPSVVTNTAIRVNHLGGGNRSLTLTPAANRHGTVTITVSASDGTNMSQRKFTLTVQPVTPGFVSAPRLGTWRYSATGIAPPAQWIHPDFDDATWASGEGPFHLQPGLPPPGGTQLRVVDRRVTTYYRRAFNVAAFVSGTPTLKLRCDDGAVVYLNGVEVWRQNLPAGPVSHTTRALTAVEGEDESTYTIIPLPASTFQRGRNTLAVSVHDVGNAREGWDVAFDAEMAYLQAPSLTVPAVLTTPEDTPLTGIPVTTADSESPPGPIRLTATSDDQSLVADTGITFNSSGTSMRIVPMPDAHGTTTLTIKASDGSSETWRSVQLTVTPLNDPPSIAPLPPLAVAYGQVPPLVLVELDDIDSPAASLTLTAQSSDPIVPASGLAIRPGTTPSQRWLRLTPAPALTSGDTTIQLTVSDGQHTGSASFVFRVSSPIAPESLPSALVRSGQNWRYLPSNLPLDDRGRPLDWINPDLDDRSWPQGNAPLGYGYANLGTTVPVQPYRITTYFRRMFHVPSIAGMNNLRLRLRYDDAAAVYLNRQLIAQPNLPRTFTESTLATTAVGQAVWQTIDVPSMGGLRAGWNHLAVEVHQSEMPRLGVLGDLIMDLELDAIAARPAAVDTLITAQDQWEYWDQAGYPDTTWKSPAFVPNEWKTGLARFGFGLGGESTVVTGGPATARRPSILLRRVFEIGDPSIYNSLHLMLQCDDGIQVFLNGERVYFDNVASSAHEGSFALSEVPAPHHLEWRHLILNPKQLYPGRNLIAVSLHQSSANNNDLAFDLQLTAGLHDLGPSLFLRPIPGGHELSWPSAYHDWRPESTTSLTPNSWSATTHPILRDGPWNYLEHPQSGPTRFFRLRRR